MTQVIQGFESLHGERILSQHLESYPQVSSIENTTESLDCVESIALYIKVLTGFLKGGCR